MGGKRRARKTIASFCGCWWYDWTSRSEIGSQSVEQKLVKNGQKWSQKVTKCAKKPRKTEENRGFLSQKAEKSGVFVHVCNSRSSRLHGRLMPIFRPGKATKSPIDLEKSEEKRARKAQKRDKSGTNVG